MIRLAAFALVFGMIAVAPAPTGQTPPLKVLFLGDNGPHRPELRFRQLQPILAKRGIDLTYTDKIDALSPQTLARYDGLIIYANTTKITPDQEKALLDFVEGGKGFIPLHCASYCFLNSPKYVALVGAQFQKHGTGVFRTTIAEPEHPLMKGFKGFESFDETYVHTRHNTQDRTVLEYRVEGKVKEPWTWVRTQGKGRVFYTAWGHDQRTWGNPGFHDLVERGIRWATARAPQPAVSVEKPFPIPEMTTPRKDVKPFEYVDVGKKIPNYKGKKGGKGEHLSRMQVPLPAEESQKHIVVPKGFHAEVFASDPLIRRPICMNWDERGRLWIAETVDYPNELQPAGKGHDRIVVLEDTKGTGRADKLTVFADKLSIPTSFTFYKGGVLVFEARRTLFLKDTDGDGKADVREVVFEKWGMGDTHGGPSNMQYGLDNWIWGMQGYNFSRLSVGGETHTFRQGFFRFKPDGSKLEFVRSTNNNTWGFGMSEEGIIFGSTANGNPSVYMPIANRYYEAVRGWTPSLQLGGIADSFRFRPITNKVRQVDFPGGYTAAAGHALYTARTYPPEYWNRTAFVAEPTGHLVGTFVLRRDGSHFRSSNPFNLMASDDEWTAPIMAEVGPDGNVWVIDWYNYIVQHNPTPAGFKTGKGAAYETDLRDKKHGRVYRIVYDGAVGVPPKGGGQAQPPQGGTPTAPFTLAGASPEKLVATLKHDNLFWRRHAQRLLVERGKQDIVPALIAAARDQGIDPIGLNVGVIHALWTLHGLRALSDSNAEAVDVAIAAMKHRSAGVRRNAVQVLPREARSVKAILAAGVLADPDPQVRLATLLTLADQPPTPGAGKAIVAVLGEAANTGDRWIPEAATCAAAANSADFLKELGGNKEPSSKLLAVSAIVAEHYARGGPVDSVGPVLARLAEADPAVIASVVRGLAKGWPKSRRPKLEEGIDKALTQLAARLPQGQRAVLVQLAGSWGSKAFEQLAADMPRVLLARVNDEKLKTEDRLTAARELIEVRATDVKTVKTLLDLITPRTPPEFAAGVLRAVQGSDAAEAGKMIVERLPTLTPGARAAGVSVVLTRPEWTKAFLDRVAEGKAQFAELSLDQRQALAEHPNLDVRRQARELLKRGGALPSADRQKVLGELLPITKLKGDPAAGKVVFKNACAKCHVHSGEGERIGPDLTGMAVHTKEHLLTDIIDPSRSVEGNFRLYVVTLGSGVILNGMLASESKTAIELFDAEGKKKTILREDIESLVASSKSLMPDGFEKQLNAKELTDLLEFLTQRGKYLPLPLDRVATVVSTRGMFYDENSKTERLVLDDWKPRTVEGVPFVLVDPQGDRTRNVILLYGPQGKIPPKMPKTVSVPCTIPAKAIHLLSGVSGWGSPYTEKGSVSMIVRLHYEDGKTEEHPLKNGEHFADYIRRVEVPGSKFAFDLRGRQMRYLAIRPQRDLRIEQIEFVKGPDTTAPVVMAVTVETRE
ncbi:MAG TPA: PVC-type heme-binding CxxCH protein [Gemmataceae bacterium]|nr:PVC-type heme-binding CxxCH protein [Gemmataceae bacterium]